MKKLVALFAICAAVAAQAAYVDWQYSVSESKGGTEWSSGYTAYLVTSSAWDGIKDSVTESALSGAATDSSSFFLASAGKKNIYSTGAGGSAGVRQASADSGNYYIILSNGEGYNVAVNNASVTAYADATGAGTGQTPGITISSSSAATGSGITFTAFGGGGGGGGVPEPTSALLLLVGGAMLALRRKQK